MRAKTYKEVVSVLVTFCLKYIRENLFAEWRVFCLQVKESCNRRDPVKGCRMRWRHVSGLFFSYLSFVKRLTHSVSFNRKVVSITDFLLYIVVHIYSFTLLYQTTPLCTVISCGYFVEAQLCHSTAAQCTRNDTIV